MRPLDLGERIVDQLPSTRNDAEPIAQLLRVLHDMRRKEHGLASAPVVDDGILQHLGVDGIETGKRLVENHEVRIV